VIVEGIVTTTEPDDSVHIAPMGPTVHDEFQRLTLRPYSSSRTFANLKRTGEGVFHVSDDVDLLARAAVGRLEETPELTQIPGIRGHVLAKACRWYAFRVISSDESQPRIVMECEVVSSGRFRDFLGFNRAKHAVVEAAILATRVKFLPLTEIREQFDRLSALVDKTGGAQERRAFDFLADYLAEHRD
jgi:hypothetical protein